MWAKHDCSFCGLEEFRCICPRTEPLLTLKGKAKAGNVVKFGLIKATEMYAEEGDI